VGERVGDENIFGVEVGGKRNLKNTPEQKIIAKESREEGASGIILFMKGGI